MLTTTVDGLWALQALTGIEVLSPELGLRPLLPRIETAALALSHPVLADLRRAGVVDAAGAVSEPVTEWLTVLARRDVALFTELRAPDGATPLRALLARYARWWAVLERRGDIVALSGVGQTSERRGAESIIAAEIERLCGPAPPAPLHPVTLPLDAVRAAGNATALKTVLAHHGADADQIRLLLAAADPQRSTRASLVALQSGIDGAGAARTHVEPSAVTIIDIAEGRLCAEQTVTGGRGWSVIAPGTSRTIAAALDRMLHRLPAPDGWHCHRKAV